MKRCAISECINDAMDTDFCNEHSLALEAIEEKYHGWKKAYGEDFSFEQYLTSLTTTPKVGKNILDVVTLLLKQLRGRQ